MLHCNLEQQAENGLSNERSAEGERKVEDVQGVKIVGDGHQELVWDGENRRKRLL